jgi:hypothetical protein
MNYVSLVNTVLRKLREREVNSVSLTTYSQLIGDYVNEAKERVEGAYQWKRLRENISFNTVSDQQDYALAVRDRARLYRDPLGTSTVVDVTSGGFYLSESDLESLNDSALVSQQPNTSPAVYAEIPTADGLTLSLYPKPNGVYTIKARVYNPQGELVADDDELIVPSEPVWRMALALALTERGGGVGDDSGTAEQRAQLSLVEAVSREADPDEYTFREV